MREGCIGVCARVRPLSKQETERGETSSVTVHSPDTVTIWRPTVYAPGVDKSSPSSSPRRVNSTAGGIAAASPRHGRPVSPQRQRGPQSVWSAKSPRNAAPQSPRLRGSASRGRSCSPEQESSLASLLATSRLTFTFDAAFDSPAFADAATLQEQIYANTGRPLLQAALAGVSGCLFAYGQTGSGKTFSMLGSDEAPGVLPQLADELFHVKRAADPNTGSSPSAEAPAACPEGLRVQAAFLELYNERLVDLLSAARESLKIFERGREGVVVPGLSEFEVGSRAEFQDLYDMAVRSRTAGATRMNRNSSRSHAIVQLRLQHQSGNDAPRVAKIFIIDLAGSERPKSGLIGSTPNKDGININVSLSTLGLVISRLADIAQGSRGHSRSACSVPFRDSKLTFLLKDSLSGNARTQVLITLSPAGSSYEESTSTLRFAHSVKRLSTRAVPDVVKVNPTTTAGDTQALQMEIDALRAELAALRSTGSLNKNVSNSTCSSVGTCDFGPSPRHRGNGWNGDGITMSSQSRVGPEAACNLDVESFTGMYTAPNGRSVEVTSDGWLRAIDWDGPQAVRLLRPGSLQGRDGGSESGRAPSISSCESGARMVMSPVVHTISLIPSTPTTPPTRKPSNEVPSPSGDRGGTGDRSPPSSQRVMSNLEAVREMLAGAGFAGQHADKIIEDLGIESIEDLAVLTPEDLEPLTLKPVQRRKFQALVDVQRAAGVNAGRSPSVLTLMPTSPSSGAIRREENANRGRDSVRSRVPQPAEDWHEEDMYLKVTNVQAVQPSQSTPPSQSTSENKKGSRASSEDGWQVSLCERVAICYPSGLPSKDKIVHRKVPRPVSPDAHNGDAAREPEWPAKGAKPTGKRGRRSLGQDHSDEPGRPTESEARSKRAESSRSESKSRLPKSPIKSPVRSMPRTPRMESRQTNVDKSEAANAFCLPSDGRKSEESAAALTLAAARAALATLNTPAGGSASSTKQRPQSADPRHETRSLRNRPWRSLTPSTPSCSAQSSRRPSLVSGSAQSSRRPSLSCWRRKLGVSAGPGDSSINAGAFDRNSLRLRNGAIFVDALEMWRADNAHVPLASTARTLLPGTCAVYVRKRPMFGPEVKRCDFDVLTVVGPRDSQVESASGCCQEIVHHTCMFDKSATLPIICHTRFPFDGVFDANASNEDVYQNVARPLLENAMCGNLSTLFVFGQTGSGKTYTMQAIERLIADELFEKVNSGQLGGSVISLACCELSGRKALDLLTEPKAEIRLREEEDGCFRPHDCQEVLTSNAEELQTLLHEAYSRRATDATTANSTSSRSHSVSRITIACGGQTANGLPTRPPGQLLLVDCAGLERARDTLYFRGQTQRESADINSSLFALKDCIRFRQAAINRHGGLPQDGSLKLPSVRAAPLTKVLAQSLTSASAQLAAIATVSPNATDAEVSIDTLRNIYLLGGQGEAHISEERQVLG